MKSIYKMFVVAIGLWVGVNAAWAYGGGGSNSSSCSEPQFYEEKPGKNAVLPELSEIFIVASANTDVQTLEFEVGATAVKPQVTTRRSGELELLVKLPEPVKKPGKVRIALTAKSKDGCAGYFPYFVEIKP